MAKFLALVCASAFAFVLPLISYAAERVEFGSPVNGSIRITGSGFTKRTTSSSGAPLEVAIIQSYRSIATVPLKSNGTFEYRTKRGELEEGATLWVEVQMYVSSYDNWVSPNFTVPSLGSAPREVGTDWNPSPLVSSELRNNRLVVRGSQFRSNARSSLTARILLYGEEIGQTPISSSGSFGFTTINNRAKGYDQVKIEVRDYKGLSQDFSIFTKIPYWYDKEARVEFGSFENEQLTITGRHFDSNITSLLKLNIYVDGSKIETVQTGPDGRFSYRTTRGLVQPGQTVKVVAPEYLGEGRDLVATHVVPQSYNPLARLEISALEEGVITVRGTSITRTDGASLNAQIIVVSSGQRRTLTTLRLNNDGSFHYSAGRGQVRCGDTLTVIVANYFAFGRDLTASKVLPTAGNGCWNVMPESQVNNSARENGRLAFERLAATYGAREIYRLSFVDGFWAGYQTGNNDSAIFESAVSSAKEDARTNGTAAGRNAAREMAVEQAAREARQRFMPVAEGRQSRPDLSVNFPRVNFDHLTTTTVPADFDVEVFLRELQNRHSYDLEKSWERGGLRVKLAEFGADWTLTHVYRLGNRSAYRVNLAWANGEWALEQWLKNALGNDFDQRLYRELGPNQRSLFVREFKEAFASILASRVNTLNRVDPIVVGFAERFGRQVGQKVAHARGTRAGYKLGFELAARLAASQAFPGNYSDEFSLATAHLHHALATARTASERVVATYGKRELFTRDFYAGFKEAFLSTRQTGATHARYRAGVEAGKADGERKGKAQGELFANERAGALAPQEVEKRFLSAVDGGLSNPDLQVRLPVETYSGDPSVRTSVDLAASFARLQPQLDGELSAVRFENGGLVVDVRGTLLLSYIYKSGYPVEYRVNDGYLSQNYGLQELRSRRLGQIDSQYSESLSGVHRENYDVVYSRSFETEATRLFNRMITERSRPAHDLGRRFGSDVGASHLEGTGLNDGFNQVYREASRKGFDQVFGRVYESTFSRRVDYFRSNAVLVVRNVSLVDGNGDFIFNAGETIGVRLGEVLNLGMVEARDVPYSLEGEGLTRATSRERLAVRGLTKLKGVVLPSLAKIDQNARDGVSLAATFKIENGTYPLNYRLGWTAMLAQYGSNSTTDEKVAQMRESILNVLRKDWIDWWMKRWIGWGDADSMLGQMVTFYEGLPHGSAGRIRLAELSEAIAEIPPARPPWGQGGNKSAFVSWAKRLTNP